jgi:hypothetical protein
MKRLADPSRILIRIGAHRINAIGLNTTQFVNRCAFNQTIGESIMSTASKVEILSICAAFAFMTGVLVAVW